MGCLQERNAEESEGWCGLSGLVGTQGKVPIRRPRKPSETLEICDSLPESLRALYQKVATPKHFHLASRPLGAAGYPSPRLYESEGLRAESEVVCVPGRGTRDPSQGVRLQCTFRCSSHRRIGNSGTSAADSSVLRWPSRNAGSAAPAKRAISRRRIRTISSFWSTERPR